MNTCLSLWEHEADGIIRLYVSEDRLKKVAKILKWCAQKKRPYHVVTAQDLEKITKSVHHEGIALILKPKLPMVEEAFFPWLKSNLEKKLPLILLYLDGLKNPHNLGSVVRTAAHFGSPIILGRMGELPRMSPSAARIAEGGMLKVECVSLKNPSLSLEALRSEFGFELVGTQSAFTEKMREQTLSPRTVKGAQKGLRTSLFTTPFKDRTILVLGNEVTGMSKEISEIVDRNVYIPGSGQVESLNVGVAAGVLLGEFWRLYGQKA